MVERDPGVPSCQNRAVRNGLLQELIGVLSRGGIALQEYVRVRVDQAWQYGRVREVDQLRIRRYGAMRRDGHNLPLGHDNDGIRNRWLASAVN